METTRADLIRQLEEAQRRVEAAKRRWLWALPHQANQAYLRYLAEEEYLGRLLDSLAGRDREEVTSDA